MDASPIEQTPSTEPVTPPQEQTPEAPVSIADHAANFGPNVDKAEDADGEPPVEPKREQKRDDNGQYRDGFKRRHRAQSQQASAEDVPRIRELTAKQRAAEDRVAALERELEGYKTRPTPSPAIEQLRAQAQQMPAMQGGSSDPNDPEPQESDERYANNWPLYLTERNDWGAREQYRRMEIQRQQQQFHQQRMTTWNGRAAETAKKYADFQAVAFQPIAPDLQQRGWRPGSVIDAFIMDDDNGPEILYHLQSNRQEVDELLSKSPLQQLKWLSLLSQRFSSTTPEAAGSNGAAPGTKVVVLPPKPPTPLRTEAQRATPTPPPTDGSLSIADHARHFGPNKRRA